MTEPKFIIGETVLAQDCHGVWHRLDITALEWTNNEIIDRAGRGYLYSGWLYKLNDPRMTEADWCEEPYIRKLPPDEDNQEWEKFKSKLELGNPSPIKINVTEEIT